MMDTEKQQLLLAYLGYYTLRRRDGTLAIDGIPGPATRQAVRSFQLGHRRRPDGTELWVDGAWGPATEAAVRQAIGTDEPPMDLEEAAHPAQIPADIWTALSACGLPPEAVAGIMGNLDAESRLQPTNMEDQYEAAKGFTDLSYTQAVDAGVYPNFVDDHVGYGLAQWTWPSRKQGLLRYAQDSGRSIGSATMQTEFLIREIRQDFPDLLSRLMTCRDVRTATEDFLTAYEHPADEGEDIRDDRTARAQIYYDRYAPQPVSIWEHPRVKPYFKRSEFACPCPRCGGFPAEPAEDLVWACVEVRKEANRRKPNTVFLISSAVRCQEHNDELPGSVPDSRHVRGRAVDFFLPGFTSQEILEMAKANKRIVYAYIMKSGWVHMDIGN